MSRSKSWVPVRLGAIDFCFNDMNLEGVKNSLEATFQGHADAHGEKLKDILIYHVWGSHRLYSVREETDEEFNKRMEGAVNRKVGRMLREHREEKQKKEYKMQEAKKLIEELGGEIYDVFEKIQNSQ